MGNPNRSRMAVLEESVATAKVELEVGPNLAEDSDSTIISSDPKVPDEASSNWLLTFDMFVSTPVFELTLPVTAEWLLSLPGSVFGMPIPMTLSPLVVAARNGGPVLTLLLVEFLVFVAVWVYLIPKGQLRVLCKTDPILVALIVGNLLFVHTYNPSAFGISAFAVGVFSAVVGIVAPIKQYSQRLRPNFVVRFAQPRHLPIGPSAVQSIKSEAKTKRDQHASFPSGDAASCAAFCTTVLLGTEAADFRSAVAVCTTCIVLCCFGRMYWRHHHFLDVTCGSILGSAVAIGLHAVVGFECGWLHVLLLTVGGAALNEFTTA